MHTSLNEYLPCFSLEQVVGHVIYINSNNTGLILLFYVRISSHKFIPKHFQVFETYMGIFVFWYIEYTFVFSLKSHSPKTITEKIT